MSRTVMLALALVVAAACSRGAGGDGNVVLTLQVWGEREETSVYRAVANAFHREHPQTEVNVVDVADKDDHLLKLTRGFAAGDPPDLFLVNFREYSQFVTRGAIVPYEGFLGDMGTDLDDYYPAPVASFTYGGELQCMPQNVSSLVVYYNVELFEAARVEPPHEGWIWDDFRAAGRDLTQGDVRGIGIEPSIVRVAPFVWSNGGELVDDDERPTGFALDEPAEREALEFVVSLARDGLIPTEKEVAAQDLQTRFVTGKLAMLLSSRRDTPALREVRGLEWDVGPLPVSRQPAGILHSDGYCISAGGRHTGQAAEFVAFATGPSGQAITALGGRTVPSLVSVSRSGAFLDPSRPPANSQAFLDAIEGLRATPIIPTWPEIEDIAQEILTRAFYEPGYTTDDAIAALEAETAALFEEGVEALP